jgi:outer membrane protein assembly factor BamB
MRKTRINRSWIFLLLFIIASIVAWLVVGKTYLPKEFPLSEKWATKLNGNIQQIAFLENRTIIARTLSDIYALDVKSGNLLWQQSTVWHFPYRPVLAGTGRLFFTDGKGVLALNQSDGNLLWQQPLRHPSGSEVVDVTQDLIAVNDPPYLDVYRAEDGILLWSTRVCRERVQAYFFDTTIVVPCFGLRVMDAVSGESIWESKSDDGKDRIWNSAFMDGVIYSSQDLKNITAYDLKNRKQLWITPLANDHSQDFKVFRDYLFVTKDDQVCVLHRSDGWIIWCAKDLIKAKNPVIFGGYLYLFNGLRNGITAYDAHDGSQIGRLDLSTYNFITVENDKQLMVSTDEFLIFANGKTIFAYGN